MAITSKEALDRIIKTLGNAGYTVGSSLFLATDSAIETITDLVYRDTDLKPMIIKHDSGDDLSIPMCRICGKPCSDNFCCHCGQRLVRND